MAGVNKEFKAVTSQEKERGRGRGKNSAVSKALQKVSSVMLL